MDYYTYLWLREDGTPYYVGKGKMNRAYRQGSPAIDRILIQSYLTEADAFIAEKFLISYYGRKDMGTGILRNHTDGGEGFAGKSVEARRRLSEVNRGNKNAVGNKGGRYVRTAKDIARAVANCRTMNAVAQAAGWATRSHPVIRTAETVRKWRQSVDVEKLKVASAMGKHTRWHLKRGIVNPACEFCNRTL